MKLLGKVKIHSAKIIASLSACGHGDGLFCHLELIGCLPRKRKPQDLILYTYRTWEEVEVKLKSDHYNGIAPHEKVSKADLKAFLADLEVELDKEGGGGWPGRFESLELTPELIEQVKQAILDEGSDNPPLLNFGERKCVRGSDAGTVVLSR